MLEQLPEKIISTLILECGLHNTAKAFLKAWESGDTCIDYLTDKDNEELTRILNRLVKFTKGLED